MLQISYARNGDLLGGPEDSSAPCLASQASDAATEASNAFSTYPTISGAPSGDGITVQLRTRPRFDGNRRNLLGICWEFALNIVRNAQAVTVFDDLMT